MDKLSKTKTIVRAFTQKSDIDEEIRKLRASICSICPYNSNNATNDLMSIDQVIRKKLTPISKPFCVACDCQINEKISQETEECGLGQIGKRPKWNRLRVETVDKSDLDLINLNPLTANVDLITQRRCYLIDFGKIERGTDVEFEFLLKSKEQFLYDLTYFYPSCGTCTEATYEKINNTTNKCYIKLDLTEFKIGEFDKKLYFGYSYKDKTKRVLIRLVGEKIENNEL